MYVHVPYAAAGLEWDTEQSIHEKLRNWELKIENSGISWKHITILKFNESTIYGPSALGW